MSIAKKVGLGFLMGITGPLMVLLVIYLSKYDLFTFYEFIENAYQNYVLSIFLSLAVVINLGTFWLLINRNRIYLARGVILATFVIGLFILLLKFDLL